VTWQLRGLWRKEWLQQRSTLLGTALVLVFWVGVRALSFRLDAAATQPMIIVAETLLWCVPLIGLTQAQAMVVREYSAKTQLFVEALPLRRWEMPLAKFTWGLVTQAALALAIWLAVALISGARDAQFLAITGVRTLAFTFSCWSLLFGLATLGRVRWLAYSTLIALFWVLAKRGVEIGRFGPLGLIDTLSFPYERRGFPVRALLESLTSAGVGLALGLLLPVLHEGSLAEVLARRASTGEKAGFWVVILCQVLIPTWVSREQRRAPFSFTSEAVISGARWNTQVMYGVEALEPRARSVLDMFDRLAAGLATELGVAEPPALRVAHNPSLTVWQRVASTELGAGVLLEANFGAQSFSLDELSVTATRRAFVELSAGRAFFEPNRWFAEGFCQHWAPRTGPPARDHHWLQALISRRTLALDASELSHWDYLSERLGEEASNSLGFLLIEVLERRHGREVMLSIARTLLARVTVRNGLDVLLGRRADLPLLLEQKTGESWPSFVASFQTELDLAAARLADPLGKIPALSAKLAVESTELGGEIVYQLSGPPPETNRSCVLRHTQLAPYDVAVWSGQYKDSTISWGAGLEQQEGRLRGQYQSGQRLLAVIECWLPELAGWVRLEARRLEVP